MTPPTQRIPVHRWDSDSGVQVDYDVQWTVVRTRIAALIPDAKAPEEIKVYYLPSKFSTIRVKIENQEAWDDYCRRYVFTQQSYGSIIPLFVQPNPPSPPRGGRPQLYIDTSFGGVRSRTKDSDTDDTPKSQQSPAASPRELAKVSELARQRDNNQAVIPGAALGDPLEFCHLIPKAARGRKGFEKVALPAPLQSETDVRIGILDRKIMNYLIDQGHLWITSDGAVETVHLSNRAKRDYPELIHVEGKTLRRPTAQEWLDKWPPKSVFDRHVEISLNKREHGFLISRKMWDTKDVMPPDERCGLGQCTRKAHKGCRGKDLDAPPGSDKEPIYAPYCWEHCPGPHCALESHKKKKNPSSKGDRQRKGVKKARRTSGHGTCVCFILYLMGYEQIAQLKTTMKETKMRMVCVHVLQ